MAIAQHIDRNGVVRKLGWVPPSADKKLMRAGRASVTPIPRSQWQPVDNVSPAVFGTRMINNQGNYGACVGYSAAQAMMRQRALRGAEFVKLSGAFIYDQINGGRDNGASIIDSMNTIETVGTPPESSYSQPIFRAGRMPSGVAIYKEDVACQITDFDDVATCILLGGFPQFAICVDSNFERFDSHGIAGTSRSRVGNHSVHGAGLIQINGAWFILMPNSWGVNWGPFVDSNPAWAGCCLLSEAAINNCAGDGDNYCHLSTVNPAGQSVPVPA